MKTTQNKKSKKLGTVPKKETPKVNKFIKMFDAVIFGKGQNVALNEEVKKINILSPHSWILLIF